ncbi:MAG: hypothetical protein GXO83_07095 [Chlorobi bacterium]|nr:hypothetical protein [Chlorobiota bacterium]
MKDIEYGKVNRALMEKSYAGGKGIHVAMGIHELGEEVRVLGFWGGENGKWIKSLCEKIGIRCFGPEVKGWNRTCMTFKSDSKYNETEILGKGPYIKEKEFLGFLADYKRLLAESDCVVMSGSWPESFNNADYSVFLEMAGEKNKVTFIDCSGDLLRSALDFYPDTVHISYREGQSLYRKNDSVEQITGKLSKNCRQAVVTYGEKGLYMHVNNILIHALARVKHVISAVGSGDSLVAGLVYAYIKSYTIEDTARLAAACGAANCIREDLGMFYKKDVDRLFNQVELSEMKQ